jgi:hypothetical protein
MARNDLILTNGTILVAYPGLETMSDVDGCAKKLAMAGMPSSSVWSAPTALKSRQQH